MVRLVCATLLFVTLVLGSAEVGLSNHDKSLMPPFASMREFSGLVESVSGGMCVGGIVHKLDGALYGVILAEYSGKVIVMRYAGESADLVWFGAVGTEGSLVLNPAMHIQDAKAKYSGPCDYFDRTET